jgi:DNA-binding LacI/PurR family transcriptional regulator/DNA-binding transcriptional regulator YhcF (GntR family)
MLKIRFPTITEQVADHLRGELERGRWAGLMPGKHGLAAELGVNNKTVEAALRQLEAEGQLVAQGAGRRRRIELGSQERRKMLRISLLLNETVDQGLDYIIELRHRLQEMGHAVEFAQRTLVDLRNDVVRLAGLVETAGADAWVVFSGSRRVLEWFVDRKQPVFAVFGRRGGLPLAAVGPDKPSAMIAATETLARLGHQRIVLLVRTPRRLPVPGEPEQAFLKQLETHGIKTSQYNLPDWEETPAGFHKCLDELFRVTPPTALIIDETALFFATYQFFTRRGLRVPEDISLIATDPHPAFDWWQPSVAHIHWESEPIVRRVLKWTANIRRGRADTQQSLTKAVFVHGGTIGPARDFTL